MKLKNVLLSGWTLEVAWLRAKEGLFVIGLCLYNI